MMACMRSGGDCSLVVHPDCGCCSAHCCCFRNLDRGSYQLLRRLERESVRPSPYFPVTSYDPLRRGPMGAKLIEWKKRSA